MTLTLYGLKNCDTCKKALKALESAGKPVEFVDIRTGVDLANKVPGWLKAVGAAKLVNTRSTTFRELSDDDKSIAKGETPLGVLVNNPTLIKRPVIEEGDAVYVGWTKDVEAALV